MNTLNIISDRRNIQDLTSAVTAHQDPKSHKLAVKIDVLTHYGEGKLACVKCGFSDVRALCIDHINGVEPTEFCSPIPRGGVPLYNWLMRDGFPSGYQTLCFNCNIIKAHVDYDWYK